ncbi:hypothetical protein [Marinigracilibium pacificum]|uniref:Uncharacterized protein n=1 Tax=Marinigracilibium pacificum TaxID=2729599 RepID=A0A848IXY1_9BACT|nr:hypothetical protein [Marinigracilibium pacificum]NMM48028.1 hypothetical protein [Marinigracilibium pacificum]
MKRAYITYGAYIIMFLVMLTIGFELMGQPNPPGPPPTGPPLPPGNPFAVPFGGLEILVAAGAALGIKKLVDARKKD